MLVLPRLLNIAARLLCVVYFFETDVTLILPRYCPDSALILPDIARALHYLGAFSLAMVLFIDEVEHGFSDSETQCKIITIKIP